MNITSKREVGFGDRSNLGIMRGKVPRYIDRPLSPRNENCMLGQIFCEPDKISSPSEEKGEERNERSGVARVVRWWRADKGPVKGMKKGGRDNGGDCTKESRCNPAARVVARETERGGCDARNERVVETGFHSAVDGTNDISTRFRFPLVENNCPSRIWEIHREMNNGCFFVVVFFFFFLVLFIYLFRQKSWLGWWENDWWRREIIVSNGRYQFITFHGKVRAFWRVGLISLI